MGINVRFDGRRAGEATNWNDGKSAPGIIDVQPPNESDVVAHGTEVVRGHG